VTRWLTHLGGARATIGLGLLLIALGEQLLGLAALFALTTSHLVVQVLKRAVARPRPCDAHGRPLALIDLPDPFSFPSGHAAAATAVSGTIAFAHPLLTPVLLPLVALIAASRVTLRVHHVGDVIGGVFLGLGGAVAAATLLLTP
jgi:undecaprenyl-diphosphatase